MSFDYNTINEDNYQEISDYIAKNTTKFARLRKQKNELLTQQHLKNYNIVPGTKFTYDITVSGERYVFYLRVTQVKKTRAICNGVAVFPEPRPVRAIDVAIVNIIPEQ